MRPLRIWPVPGIRNERKAARERDARIEGAGSGRVLGSGRHEVVRRIVE